MKRFTDSLILLLIAVFTSTPIVKAQSFFGTETRSPLGDRGFSPNWTYNPQLEFDNDGLPMVAYIDPTTDKPTIKKWDGTQWTVFGTESFTSQTLNNLRFQVGPNGEKFIAINSSGTITVHQWVSGQWNQIGGSYTTSNDSHELFISNVGTLYLAYRDLTDPNFPLYPRVLRYDGTWTSIGDEGFSEVGAYMMDMTEAGGLFFLGYRRGRTTTSK